ncbi:LamG-like jellyroll fold domain-containing protein, partial [Planctomycetota bacterium]
SYNAGDPDSRGFVCWMGDTLPHPIYFADAAPVEKASCLSPANGATDVLRDSVLIWKAGSFATSHNVYLGLNLNDVNDADDSSPLLVGPDLVDTTFDPGRLILGETYFWRIDEVNDAHPDKLWKGDVWSFDVEPVGILVEQLTATASSQNSADEPPDNTINGVGLNEDGSHSQDKKTMWLSAFSDPGAAWIRYDLPAPQKLNEMLVWNHNTQVEEDLGYGFKDALIEVSTDGVSFTSLGTVELLQAAETTVDLQEVVAQSVRITAQNNWGDLIPKFGVSAVRLYAIPNVARELSPADGEVAVDPVTAVLTWRAGREAAVHDVYVSTDQQAVIDGTAPVVTVATTSYVPDLDLDMTYYWRVDEVNDLEDPAVWAGGVQNFSTAASIVVDDMESYKVNMWETWADGYEDPTNGALVGNGWEATPETETVHEGSKSMPMTYGDAGIQNSWTTRSIEDPIVENWSKHGIKSLSLYVHGLAGNVGGQLYVKVNDTQFDYQGAASDIQLEQWFPWTIDLTGISVVNSVTIGVAGGAGTIYVDSIILTPEASELINPVVPDATELLGSYSFEGDYKDGSGNGLNGAAVGGATIISDPERGSVLSLDGIDSCVDLGLSTDKGLNPAGSFSLAAWVNIGAFTANWGHIIVGNRGESDVGWQLRRHAGNPNLTFTVRGTDGADDPRGTIDALATVGTWIQVTAVYDTEAGVRTVYFNGLVDTSIADSGVCAPTTHNVYIGARANGGNTGPEGFFNGLLDDVKVYNRALSQAEALSLAGRTEPVYKPF